MMTQNISRIAIIGNGGGGKSTLARALSAKLSLPLTHVDSIQYLSGMKERNQSETAEILNRFALEESWLIDGFGSYEVIRKRFSLADKIIFVDFPLWRHYWWCTKRQINSIWNPSPELPTGCHEASLSNTIMLYKTLWRVHTQVKPKLMTIFKEPEITNKVIYVSNIKEWNLVFEGDV